MSTRKDLPTTGRDDHLIREKVITCLEYHETHEMHERAVYAAIQTAAKTFGGKQIGQRLATAVKKLLPEYTVYIESTGSGTFGRMMIHAWGGAIPFDEKVSMFLCQTRDKDSFDLVEFERNFTLTMARSDETLLTLRNAINGSAKLVQDYNAALDRFNEAKAAVGPVLWAIQK